MLVRMPVLVREIQKSVVITHVYVRVYASAKWAACPGVVESVSALVEEAALALLTFQGLALLLVADKDLEAVLA